MSTIIQKLTCFVVDINCVVIAYQDHPEIFYRVIVNLNYFQEYDRNKQK
jgi:hypothetical protein